MQTFQATYRLRAKSADEAQSWAENVAREQTIECVDDGVPHGFIFDEVLAKVVSLQEVEPETFDAVLAFNVEVTGFELPQLLNMLYGNTSLHPVVKLVDVNIPRSCLSWLPGARFGVEGVRKLTGSSTGALMCAAVKPIGLSSDECAEIAYQCALGGADMIKDDHGLANQKWAPFQERVEAMAKAIARANRETGGNTLYAPSMNCPFDEFEKRAHFVVDAGAQAFLVMPSLTGFDSMRFLATHPKLAKPIMMHPAFMGSYMMGATTGIAPEVMYAQYARLAGADISIFPSFGGRYGNSVEQCAKIAEACRDPKSTFKPILPGPGGGMKLELVTQLKSLYGLDTMFVVGGAAMKYRDKIAGHIREMKQALAASRI